MTKQTGLLKDMDTAALKSYIDDLQVLLDNAISMRKTGIGWMVRQHEIGTAILRRRAREAR